mmetsp:Transcript_16725/g.33439  ORF Transcript_16725/g.33439 Transcript_16725/m.33439 type:complete len:185 (+) Transcript_16725:67-621(+)
MTPPFDTLCNKVVAVSHNNNWERSDDHTLIYFFDINSKIMTKFNTQQFKQSPHSAGHKRSRPLSSVCRIPSLTTLVISDTSTSNDCSSSSSSSSRRSFCLTPARKSEMRKGWGSFKSRQRYTSLTSLDSGSTISTTSSTLSSSSQVDMLSSTPYSTPSTPVSTISSIGSSDDIEVDTWGFFADF